MELCPGASDIVAIVALSRISPLVGVTTNLSIIAAGKKPLEVVFPQLHEATGGQGRLFAWVTTTTAERIVNDARKLRSIIADIVVKAPVTVGGLAAAKMLKAERTPTLGIAVCGIAQGLLSVLVGTEYIVPYANRIGAQDGSDIQAVTDLYRLLKVHAPQARMLAASFKTPCQALDCLLAGCGSITPSLDVAQQMISYPTVNVVAAKFEQD